MKFDLTGPVSMRTPGGEVILEAPTLEVETSSGDRVAALRFRFELDAEAWRLADAARAFHLEPAARGPTLLGEDPAGVRVAIEAAPTPATLAHLVRGGRPPVELAAALATADPADPARDGAGWYALAVTREVSPGVRAGFETAWRAALTGRFDALDPDRLDATAAGVVALAGTALEAVQAGLIDWLAAEPAPRQPLVRALLATWPDWLGERAGTLVDAACTGAPWPSEELPLLERRVAHTDRWARWAGYLTRYHLSSPESPRGLALALQRGAAIDVAVYGELAMAVTTWSKGQLVPFCRAIACGSATEKAKWRLSLMKRLKGDAPAWNEIGPALEDPLVDDPGPSNPYK